MSAHVSASKVCNFYNGVLFRDGIDDKGMDLVNVVNCSNSQDETPPVWHNAESFSDIFGIMVKNWDPSTPTVVTSQAGTGRSVPGSAEAGCRYAISATRPAASAPAHPAHAPRTWTTTW